MTTPTGSGPAPHNPGVVPVEDVTRWHAGIADELDAAFRSCLPVHRFTMGPNLKAFEEEFAAYCDAASAVGVSSGTAALTLALRALGVGPGDEVVTVPNTYVATVFAITYVGATPVFVDVDPQSVNMDPQRVAAALTPRTKAILPVHMYGRCVDIEGIRAAAPGIPILEDAAHAHGATRNGRKAGSLGEIAAFSFYPSKVLGALGDGGIITTSDPDLDAKLRQLRYMGQKSVKHEHLILGYQERLDEVQGALLRVKLRHLEDQLAGRRRVAERYEELLAGTPVELPAPEPAGRHVYYMYTVHVPEREALQAFLDERGISTQIVYPKLVPDQGAYADNPWRAADDLSVARSLVPRILCLPMFAELTDEEIERVGLAIREFYGAS
ncbi:MAG: DegT/DnrJ/EryC1/StrS family aminotransferase [Chloroflexota bacterium]